MESGICSYFSGAYDHGCVIDLSVFYDPRGHVFSLASAILSWRDRGVYSSYPCPALLILISI